MGAEVSIKNLTFIVSLSLFAFPTIHYDFPYEFFIGNGHPLGPTWRLGTKSQIYTESSMFHLML